MTYQIGPERRIAYRIIVFMAAILGAVFFAWLTVRTPHSGPEAAAEDVVMRSAPAAPRSDIIIASLGPTMVQKYGSVAAIPRSALADALTQIERGGAKTVVFDLPLNHRTDTGDASLWQTMANHHNIVLGMAYDASRSTSYTLNDIRSERFLQKLAYTSALRFGPRPQFFPWMDFQPPVSDFTGSAAGVGVFDRESDPDGIVRDARLFYLSQVEEPSPLPSLPADFPPAPLANGRLVALPNLILSASQSIFGLDKIYVVIQAGHWVNLAGNLTPPVDPPVDNQGRMQIRFARPPFAQVSVAKMLNGQVSNSIFQGKVVLIGSTAPNDPATDVRDTPMGEMPRVEVTANALATLMNRSYFNLLVAHPRSAYWATLAVAVVAGVLLALVSGIRGLCVALALMIVDALVCRQSFAWGNDMLPVLPGLLTILLTYVVSLFLMLGPFRPIAVSVSPTYVPPPPDVVH